MLIFRQLFIVLTGLKMKIYLYFIKMGKFLVCKKCKDYVYTGKLNMTFSIKTNRL